MDFEQLRRDLQRLRGEDGVVTPAVAEDMVAQILLPLLSAEGFDTVQRPHERDNGLDFEATNRSAGPGDVGSIGIQYKHFGGGRPLGAAELRNLIGAGILRAHPRLMLIGRFGFTKQATDEARHLDPVRVDLLDLNDLGRWISRLEAEKPSNAALFQTLIRSISHEFAKAVAADPQMLDQLEWRDLERMMARILEGLGFRVTLTPASKDGGKDLILTYAATQAICRPSSS